MLGPKAVLGHILLQPRMIEIPMDIHPALWEAQCELLLNLPCDSKMPAKAYPRIHAPPTADVAPVRTDLGPLTFNDTSDDALVQVSYLLVLVQPNSVHNASFT